MKIITEPTVKVVGHSVFVPDPDFPIPDDGTDAEKLGAYAAKGCYESAGADKRPNVENQRHCIEQRHGNVLEHATVSLRITGITRACSLELNRHRISLSQRSTRYTREEDAAIVLDPYYAALYHKHGGDEIFLRKCLDPAKIDDMTERTEYMLVRGHLRQAEQAFLRYAEEVFLLLKLRGVNPLDKAKVPTDIRKWARGKARNILPHGLETRGTWTANHRQWRWIIQSRCSEHAESEIRRLARAIYDVLKPLAPSYYEAVSETKFDDVWCPNLQPEKV